MEGCPYGSERPSVRCRRTLVIEMVTNQTNGRKRNQREWLIALGLALSIGGGHVQAKEWQGTIGEPLRDSTQQTLELARQLNNAGAQFFGSWKCPACFQQMSMFGKQAGAQINYVECGKPKTRPKERALCEEANISAVPTWTLPNGERKVGIQQLEELSTWAKSNQQ